MIHREFIDYNSYEKYSDLDLLMSCDNSLAEEVLIRRYTRMVKSRARPYFICGGDCEDLIQEGMMGLVKAVRDFSIHKSDNFYSFAKLCVTHNILNAIQKANSLKNSPLNSYVHIQPLFEDNPNAESFVFPYSNPETLIIIKEKQGEMIYKLTKLLSKFEAQVLKFYLKGYSISEISELVNRPFKSVDNAIQRIKRKSAELF